MFNQAVTQVDGVGRMTRTEARDLPKNSNQALQLGFIRTAHRADPTANLGPIQPGRPAAFSPKNNPVMMPGLGLRVAAIVIKRGGGKENQVSAFRMQAAAQALVAGLAVERKVQAPAAFFTGAKRPDIGAFAAHGGCEAAGAAVVEQIVDAFQRAVEVLQKSHRIGGIAEFTVAKARPPAAKHIPQHKLIEHGFQRLKVQRLNTL